MKCLFIIVLLCIVSPYAAGQGKDKELTVKSWRQGSDQIVEQNLRIRVSTKNRDFSQSVFTTTGEEYVLRLVYVAPIVSEDFESGSSTESWVVELRPINGMGQKQLGDNLLRVEGVGVGGDNFPREDLIGYLYPKTTSGSKINGIPFIDGHLYYPILAPREIQVDKFSVKIRVVGYQLNPQNPHLVDFMDIAIGLKNR